MIYLRVGELKPIQSLAHGSLRLSLMNLSDEELLHAVTDPKRRDYLTVNTATRNLVDGNGRAHELIRRAADPKSSITVRTTVPVEEYTPDVSMFPDLE